MRALVLLLPLLLAPVALPGTPSPAPSWSHGVPAPMAASSEGGVQALAASLSFALTSSTAQADPTDTVVITVYFNNTGTQPAPNAWINVSAAGGFTFLGDNAAGNTSGYPDYAFGSLALGLHSFRLSLQVDIGTPPGTRLGVSATLVYSDGAGGQQFLGPASASVLVGVATKQLYLGWSTLSSSILTPVTPTGSLFPQGMYTLTPGGLAVSFDLTPALARPFRALNATAVLYLEATTPPAPLVVNLTLIDLSGAVGNPVASVQRSYNLTGTGYWTLYYTFPSMNYLFAAGHQIRLQVLDTASSGTGAILAANATAEPSRLNLQTTTYVHIDSLTPASTPTTYLSPKSSLVITANVSDPFGSPEVLAAHVNVTGPAGAVAGWPTAVPVVAVDPSSPSAWKLFRLSIGPALLDGTYAIELTAVSRNGVLDIADGAAVVRAPALTLQKIATPAQGKTGTKVTYFLWYNNTGSGPAQTVWLNDTLPSQVNFVNSSVNPTSVSGSTYAWVFNSVPVGSHVVQIFVQVKGGVSTIAYIRNSASANYSDPQGFLWPSVRSHADIVINGPFLSLTQSSAPAGAVHANQLVVYNVSLTNTGDAASMVWLNDTLPAGLSYLSDTVTAAGGTGTVVGNRVDWVFTNVASGASTPFSLAFTMTARAGSGLPWGRLLPNTIGLNDTSTNGLLMPDQVSVLALTVVAPAIAAASAAFGVSSAVPVVHLPFDVNFTNVGNEAARTVWINLTLPSSLAFVGVTGATATVSGNRVALRVSNASVGADSIAVTLAAAPSVRDGGLLSVSGSLLAADGYGNVLAPVTVSPATVSVALPVVAFTLSPADDLVESGTPLVYALTGGNTGHGTASSVWLNLTLPSGVSYVNDTFGVAAVRQGSTVSWSWRNYTPGLHAYALTLLADPDAKDGARANVLLGIVAFDLGGNPQTPSVLVGQVAFQAPSFAVTLSSDQSQALAGKTFTYTISVRNNGQTTAQTVWLTDVIDPDLTVITYNSSVPAVGTTTLNWTFQNVVPGQSIAIALLVEVKDGAPGGAQISNTVAVTYTNSVGVVLGYERSAVVPVRVAVDLGPLFWILGGGGVVGAFVVFVVYRRYRVRIEDVFLVYRDGILVSHLTKGDGLDKDEDQLSGMLTAVQDFVKDAFAYGEHRELHQLEFGDYHVLIERGKVVYLAVVYQGRDSGLIRKKVRAVLDRVESAYGDVFAEWEGDVAQVEGTRELLREGFLDTKRPWSLIQPKAD